MAGGRQHQSMLLVLLIGAFALSSQFSPTFVGGMSGRTRGPAAQHGVVPRRAEGSSAVQLAEKDASAIEALFAEGSAAEALAKHGGSASCLGVTCRQNFDVEPENLLNKQIQMEFGASHFYSAMAAYFDRADVALPGFKAWAEAQSDEERGHALKLIEYMNLRGGRYLPMDISEPHMYEYASALEAMGAALKMELGVNTALLNLHQAADEASDPQFTDFLEGNFLEEQVESINEITKIVRKLIRSGPGLGELIVDQEMGDAQAA